MDGDVRGHPAKWKTFGTTATFKRDASHHTLFANHSSVHQLEMEKWSHFLELIRLFADGQNENIRLVFISEDFIFVWARNLESPWKGRNRIMWTFRPKLRRL